MILNHRCHQSQGDMAGTGKTSHWNHSAKGQYFTLSQENEGCFLVIQVIRGTEEALQVPLQTRVCWALWAFHPEYVTDLQIALSAV